MFRTQALRPASPRPRTRARPPPQKRSRGRSVTDPPRVWAAQILRPGGSSTLQQTTQATLEMRNEGG